VAREEEEHKGTSESILLLSTTEAVKEHSTIGNNTERWG